MFENLSGAIFEALILMLGAAILAGIIVYLLMRRRQASLEARLEQQTGAYAELNRRHQALEQQHAQLQTRERQTAEALAACEQARTAAGTHEASLASLKAEYAKLEQAYAAVNQEIAQLRTAATPVAPAPPTPPKPEGKESEEAVLARIQERAQEINFDRIGLATAADKDDLKRVKGIGPFIEKKLNSIGIYTFRQIANFTPEDEDKVNEVIEFFSGRIRRDNWAGQADGLAREKEAASKDGKNS